MIRVLILGGTSEASELAAKISVLPEVEVITSLAGRTRQPFVSRGCLRIGGFGGQAGLVDYLQDQQIDLLIDATHPFAAQISWNAAAAATAVGLPHLLLLRPAWQPMSGDRWIEVDTLEAAAEALPPQAERVFLTTGRQELAPFVPLAHCWFLIRSIDPPPDPTAMPNGILLLGRGPFTLDQERQLLVNHQIEVIVSKNSGGAATYAKVLAARALNIPVVMVQRPAMPSVEQVSSVEEAVRWLRHKLQLGLDPQPLGHRSHRLPAQERTDWFRPLNANSG
jgi:precorrin-6A/cobalt-precorrin-6A reductase